MSYPRQESAWSKICSPEQGHWRRSPFPSAHEPDTHKMVSVAHNSNLIQGANLGALQLDQIQPYFSGEGGGGKCTDFGASYSFPTCTEGACYPRKVSLPDKTAIQVTSHTRHMPENPKRVCAKTGSFPMKLHDILSRPTFSHLIAWLPHGRAWKVYKIQELEELVLPIYFRSGRYSSFMRQVTGWGFRRITQGPDANAYCHEYFMRGLPVLATQMRRKQGKFRDMNSDLLHASIKESASAKGPSLAVTKHAQDSQEELEHITAIDIGSHPCVPILCDNVDSRGVFYKAGDDNAVNVHAVVDKADSCNTTLNDVSAYSNPCPFEWSDDESEDDFEKLATRCSIDDDVIAAALGSRNTSDTSYTLETIPTPTTDQAQQLSTLTWVSIPASGNRNYYLVNPDLVHFML